MFLPNGTRQWTYICRQQVLRRHGVADDNRHPRDSVARCLKTCKAKTAQSGCADCRVGTLPETMTREARQAGMNYMPHLSDASRLRPGSIVQREKASHYKLVNDPVGAEQKCHSSVPRGGSPPVRTLTAAVLQGTKRRFAGQCRSGPVLCQVAGECMRIAS